MNTLIIDHRMRNDEKKMLKSIGYNLIELPENENVYYEISSHVDIFVCLVKDTLVLEEKTYELLENVIHNNSNINIVKGKSMARGDYPNDVRYNVCIVGKYAIGNFKFVDDVLKEVIAEKSLEKININQGYSKCSIGVLDNRSVVVTDEAIANVLSSYDLDITLVKMKEKQSIKLYNDEYVYSSMYGFIGGCMARLSKGMFFSFDILNKNNFYNESDFYKIVDLLDKKHIPIIQNQNKDIIDYGGIIEI